MKRVLSLALVAVLAIGMSMSAFAAVLTNTSAQTQSLTNGVVPANPSDLSGNTWNLGTISPGHSDAIINLTYGMFGADSVGTTTNYDYTLADASNVTGYSVTGVKKADAGFSAATGTDLSRVSALTDEELYTILDTAGNVTGNTISTQITAKLRSVATLADLFSMLDATGGISVVLKNTSSTGGVMVSGSNDITDYSGTYKFNMADVLDISGYTITTGTGPAAKTAADAAMGAINSKFGSGTVTVSEVTGAAGADDIRVDVTSGVILATDNITSADISAAKIELRVSRSKGAQVIDKVSLDKKKGQIKIEFVEELVTTKDVDFDFDLYLVVNGKAYRDLGITLTGTMTNQTEEGDGDMDYFYLADGAVLDLTESARKMELDLGGGVLMQTRLSKGKYYGAATTKDDEDVMEKYPSIETALTLNTVGLSRLSGNIVSLKGEYGGNYYVYNDKLEFLGMSGEMLPFATKYYLSTEELDVGAEDDSGHIREPDEPGEPEQDPGPGGDGSGNANRNPDTGADGFLGVAVAAAAASLAAAGGVARKRR